MEPMGYALVNGVGAMVIPSPRPNEVKDLILEPFKWSFVDPVYQESPSFRRYKSAGAFEYVESLETPTDPDLEINSEYDKDLSPDQRAFVRQVSTLDLTDQMKAMISIAEHVNARTGIAPKDSKVTVLYLRERHRPMLLAIQDLETRHKKRRALLTLLKKQLERIANLPS